MFYGKVSTLSGFWLLTVVFELPLVIAVLSLSPQPTEIGLDLTLLLLLIGTRPTIAALFPSHSTLAEAILGWTAVVRMSREQSARYQLTTQPAQGVREKPHPWV